MSANIIFVHDDPEFIEEAAAALRLAGHKVVTFREPTLNAVETAPFEILITRVRFPIGQPNGVALARMARAENVVYTEGLGEAVAAPIDIPELVATVAKVASA
jgi:DNA-binding NtrC family response regulator